MKKALRKIAFLACIFFMTFCFNRITMRADEGQETVPRLVSAKSYGKGQILLTWEKMEQADGYLIYRATPNSPYDQVAQVNDNQVVSYNDSSVQDGQYYQYAIASFKEGVISELSNYICAATSFQLPVFYNGKFTEVNSSGFTFSGDFMGSYPISFVRLKIWVAGYYGDTVRIFDVPVEQDNHFSVRVNARDYWSLSGEYIIYMDGFGEDLTNSLTTYNTTILVPDGAPEIQNPTITDLDTNGYSISCNLYTEPEMDQVYVYTYRMEDLSDVHYEKYTLDGSYLNARISLEKESQKAGTYHTVVVVSDTLGRMDQYQFDVEVPAEEEPFISFSPIFVEHGDSMLLQVDGHYLLIDTGRAEHGEKVISFLKQIGVEHVSVLVTHNHSDHFGGLFDLLTNDEIVVDEIYMDDVVGQHYEDESARKKLLNLFKLSGVPVKNLPELGTVFYFYGAYFDVIGPVKNYDFTDLNCTNNQSICLKLHANGTTLLTCGDMEKNAEYDLINAQVDLKADILKMCHHGINSSTSRQLIEAVSPFLAFAEGSMKDFIATNPEADYYLHLYQIQKVSPEKNGTIQMFFQKSGTRLYYHKKIRGFFHVETLPVEKGNEEEKSEEADFAS